MLQDIAGVDLLLTSIS